MLNSSGELSQIQSATTQRTQYILITAFYFVAWFALRIPAIANNTIIGDDYVLILPNEYQVLKGQEYMFLRSYRPLIYFEYRLLNVIFPGHFSTIIPKLAGGLYISLSALVTSILFRKWGIPFLLSIAVPFLFVSHPAINQITIWHAAHSNSLAILCLISGVLVWENYDSWRRKLLGWILILLGMFGYPIYVTIPVILLIAEWPIKRMLGIRYSFSNLPEKLGFLALASIVYVGYVFASREIMKYYSLTYDVRGLTVSAFSSGVIFFDFIRGKLHSMLELMSNAYLPLISFYAGVRKARRIWRLVPISLCIITFLLARLQKRGYFISILPLMLPLIPTIPMIGMSHYAVAWRVAVPVIYGACLSILPLMIMILTGQQATLLKLSRQMRIALTVFIVAVLFAVMAPVSWGEARLRAWSSRKDAEVLKIVEQFWTSKGLNKQQYEIVVDHRIPQQDPANPLQSKVLTRGYTSLTGFSEFGHPWAYRPFIFYHGFRPFNDESNQSLYKEMISTCRRDGERIQGVTRLRILNSVQNRLSIICQDPDTRN